MNEVLTELAFKMHDYNLPRWQLISRDTKDILAVLREDEAWLSTVDLQFYLGGEQYETCLFKDGNSEVLGRFRTKEAAEEYHCIMEKRLGLTRENG